MKKLNMVILSMIIASLQAADYEQAQRDIAQIRGDSSRTLKERLKAQREAQIGAVIGAGVGATAGALAARQWIKKYPHLEQTPPQVAAGLFGAAIGAQLGGGIGLGVSEAQRRYIIWQINKVLQTYTPYTFFNLPTDAAILVLAAYRKNMKLMRQIAPRIQNFLNESGVWEVLAHLYFSEAPMPQAIMQLQQMLGIK